MGDDKNQLVSSDEKQHYLIINGKIVLKLLELCAIFLNLTNYSSFSNNSINIYNIYKLCKYPGPISNNYVNSSSLSIQISTLSDLVMMWSGKSCLHVN